MSVAQTAATAFTAFAATNIDDIVVLSVLFARRDASFKTRQIVLGQYLGFAVLVAGSLIAGAGLLALPDEAVGALGLIPIALGVRGLWRARSRGDDGEAARDGPAAMTTTAVAAITAANGADNVAIYAPLFATVGPGQTAITVVVFFALVAVWCLIGLFIGSRPAIVRLVELAGHYAVPFVLITLGLFILVESGLPRAIGG